MCIYNRLVDNPKYKKNKKNGGIIPAIKDKRVLLVPIGCGKCIECKKQKAREWQVRLQEEIRENKNGQFVTLTFDDKSLNKLEKEVLKKTNKAKGYDLDNATATLGVRRFLERWRKKYKKSVRHWLITELGHKGTERIHLHGILFTKEDKETIQKIWGYGMIWIGSYVNEKTINYIVKYITKTDKKHPEYNGKILTSAGIGKGYIKRKDSKLNKYNKEKTKEHYKTRQGIKLNMPKYYRNHIYTEEEREKLWLEKLNKEERYVLGTRIDVSTEKGMKTYEKAVENARKKNKRLGYGDNTKNYDRIKYEEQIRELKRDERVQKIIKEEKKSRMSLR